MSCISSHTLAAIDGKLFQSAYILILFMKHTEYLLIESASVFNHIEPAIVSLIDMEGRGLAI